MTERIDLRHLRSFVAVAEEGHFGRAATRLGIAQPAVSRHARALETALGAELLVRTSRRTELRTRAAPRSGTPGRCSPRPTGSRARSPPPARALPGG
jgi:hypothetical protein